MSAGNPRAAVMDRTRRGSASMPDVVAIELQGEFEPWGRRRRRGGYEVKNLVKIADTLDVRPRFSEIMGRKSGELKGTLTARQEL